MCAVSGAPRAGLGLANDGDPLEYGPVDVTVGAAERLIYEGEVTVGKGIERLPRNSTLVGGTAVFCAAALLDYADEHAPVKRYDELVAKAKNDPVFLAEQTAGEGEVSRRPHRGVRGERHTAGRSREGVRPRHGREVDLGRGADLARVVAASCAVLHRRHAVPGVRDGRRPEEVSRQGVLPIRSRAWTTNRAIPGSFSIDGGRMVIYSRAHSDRYAYFLKLFDEEDFGEDLKGLINDYNARGLGPPPSPTSPPSPLPTPPSPPSRPSKQIIQYGPLSVMADAAAKVLIDAKVPFYQRGKALVRPVVKQVQTFDGKMTSGVATGRYRAAIPARHAVQELVWVKFNKKSKKWLPIHPPVDPAQVLLKRFGDWEFPELAGIINTPTLRPDGTILKDEGYDPATQLLLIDPPAMPEIPEHPTKEDAAGALDTLKNDLLFEFMFDDDDRRLARGGAVGDYLDGLPRRLSGRADAHHRRADRRQRQELFAFDRQPYRHRAADAGARGRQERGGVGEAPGRGCYSRSGADLRRQHRRRDRR